jgi:phage/plasmid-like protein (TIGR03299 family)
MSHDILANMYAGVKELPWHRLGITYDESVPVVQAVEENGMDFQISKLPAFVDVAGVHVLTGDFALVRESIPTDPQVRFLGNCSEQYEFLQNREIAEILDANLTAVMPFETIGILGNGEKFFITLQDGVDEILPGQGDGEPVKSYFLLTDTRNGRTAMTLAYTPVRVVCQNTLTLGLNAATVQWTISHESRLRQAVDFQTRIMGQLKLAKQKSLDIMRKMATTQVVAEQVDAILKAAYPVVDAPKWARSVKSLNEFGVTLEAAEQKYLDRTLQIAQASVDRAMERREGAKVLFQRINDTQPWVANTAWAVYNGVTESESWRNPGKENARVEEAILFGDRAKASGLAFRAAAAMC